MSSNNNFLFLSPIYFIKNFIKNKELIKAYINNDVIEHYKYFENTIIGIRIGYFISLILIIITIQILTLVFILYNKHKLSNKIFWIIMFFWILGWISGTFFTFISFILCIIYIRNK